MSLDIVEIEQLLDEVEKLKPSKERNRTFLEISGYPHRETVYSNIFSFFFNTDENHGLGNLFLTSFLNILRKKDDKDQTTSVETEVYTNEGKRIDIVLETSSYLIGIENKVLHYLNNPLYSYANYLENRSKNTNNLEVLKVILCLNDSGMSEMRDEDLNGFKVVTYLELFDEIRSQIGSFLIQSTPKYLTMLFDFMETIENISKGSNMDIKFLELIKKKGDLTTKFLSEISLFRKELRQKVQNLGSKIDFGEPVKQWYWRDTNDLYDILVHDITFSENEVVAIDTYLSVNGWDIDFFYRKGGNLNKLKNLLSNANIEVTDKHLNPNHKGFSYANTFDYEADNQNDLVETLQCFIKKLTPGKQ